MAKVTMYQQMMGALKDILKKRKLGYLEVAEALDMSESSIKRLFNAPDGNLGKIESICDWLELTVADLMFMLEEEDDPVIVMTPEQEAFFLKHPSALQFYLELVEFDRSVADIQDEFFLTNKSVTFYLNRLEDIGLIKVFPGNVVKNAVKEELTLSNGELAKKLLRHTMDSIYKVTAEKMDHPPESKEKTSHLKTGELLFTPKTAKEILHEYEEFGDRIHKLSTKESRLYPKNELVSHTYFNALLPQKLFTERIVNID